MLNDLILFDSPFKEWGASPHGQPERGEQILPLLVACPELVEG